MITVIYGQAGSGKSKKAIRIAKMHPKKKIAYIDLEGHKDVSFRNNVHVLDNKSDIRKAINDNDLIIIDYIELLNYSKKELTELKNSIDSKKKLIIVSCGSKEEKSYDFWKKYADRVIFVKRKRFIKKVILELIGILFALMIICIYL